MSVIDPDSPLAWTICGNCHQRHELGEVDCDGYPVNYITAGTVWESHQEHDLSIASGRAFDAWKRWVVTGGFLPEPDCMAIIRASCMPQWEDEAMRDVQECVELFSSPGATAYRARRANRN